MKDERERWEEDGEEARGTEERATATENPRPLGHAVPSRAWLSSESEEGKSAQDGRLRGRNGRERGIRKEGKGKAVRRRRGPIRHLLLV